MLNIPDPKSSYFDYMNKLDEAGERQIRCDERVNEIMEMKVEDFLLLATKVGHDDTVVMVMERVAEMLVDEERDE